MSAFASRFQVLHDEYGLIESYPKARDAEDRCRAEGCGYLMYDLCAARGTYDLWRYDGDTFQPVRVKGQQDGAEHNTDEPAHMEGMEP